MSQVNVLLVGDVTDAPWHPLEPAQAALEDILGDGYQLDSTEDYERLALLGGSDADADVPLVISYTDCWNRSVTPAQAAGLLRYVTGGGKLLVIHNGISLQASYELAQMIGGKFVSHPPLQPLVYSAAGEGHPVMDGVSEFTIVEEPYMYELDTFSPRNVFLEYTFEGERYPAGWEQSYGLGRVVYLQPGHYAPSFEPESYRQLIRNCADWLCGN